MKITGLAIQNLYCKNETLCFFLCFGYKVSFFSIMQPLAGNTKSSLSRAEQPGKPPQIIAKKAVFRAEITPHFSSPSTLIMPAFGGSNTPCFGWQE